MAAGVMLGTMDLVLGPLRSVARMLCLMVCLVHRVPRPVDLMPCPVRSRMTLERAMGALQVMPGAIHLVSRVVHLLAGTVRLVPRVMRALVHTVRLCMVPCMAIDVAIDMAMHGMPAVMGTVRMMTASVIAMGEITVPPVEMAVAIIVPPIRLEIEGHDGKFRHDGIVRKQDRTSVIEELQIGGINPAAFAGPADIAPVIIGKAAVNGDIDTLRYRIDDRKIGAGARS
jgi:hypothetical protein